MKIRLFIQCDEQIDGNTESWYQIISPADFPVSIATVIGMLEITKARIIEESCPDPDDGEGHHYEPDPLLDEFRRKMNDLIDEYEEKLTAPE